MSMWMLCDSVRGLELRETKSQRSKSGGVCAVLLDPHPDPIGCAVTFLCQILGAPLATCLFNLKKHLYGNGCSFVPVLKVC